MIVIAKKIGFFFLSTAVTAHQLVIAIRLKAASLSCEFYVRSGI